VEGFGFIFHVFVCDNTVQQWSSEVVPVLGRKFIGGKATSFTYASGCTVDQLCGDDTEEVTVTISRR